MNLYYTDFIGAQTGLAARDLIFLVDTQADISIIKCSSIEAEVELDESDLIVIKGVTDGKMMTMGSVQTSIYFKDMQVEQRLHVVPDEFSIPVDGILGRDFLKQNGCEISYKTMTMTMDHEGISIPIPFYAGPEKDRMIIPPRCEVVRRFDIKMKEGELWFADSQQLAEGVYTANAVLDSGRPLIRVINTTNEPKVVRSDGMKTTNMNQFNVYSFDAVRQSRSEELMRSLETKFPEYVRKDLTKLCTEFADVFALRDDTMSLNNFYTQKLRMSDAEPVYQKNYRLAQTQRQEIKGF